jgi:hypothetical protein
MVGRQHSMISVHDNFVLGYAVDLMTRTLVIRTEYRDQGEPFERTNVRFEGVIGYLIRDCLDSVLFDIEEESIESIIRDFTPDLEWGAKYGWPWPGASGPDGVRERVALGDVKTYSIQGASTFDGFVIARSMTFELVE